MRRCFAQEVLNCSALRDADCGLPPHSAERLGLSGSDLSSSFPEAEPQEKSLRETLRKAIGIPRCAAASRNRCCPPRSNTL